MATQRLTKHNAAMVKAAVGLLVERGADALLVLLEGSTDWKRISEMIDPKDKPVIVAVDSADDLEGASEAGLKPLALNKEKAPLLERLQHALLEAAADELIRTNGEVVAVNEALPDALDKLNDDPYGPGWIVKIKLSDDGGIEQRSTIRVFCRFQLVEKS